MHLLSGLWEKEGKEKIRAHIAHDACVEYNQFCFAMTFTLYETEVGFYCKNATYFSEIAH